MSTTRPTNPFNLCIQKFANGRTCGLPASPKHDGLCLPHARQQNAKQPPREDYLTAELKSPGGDFITQIDINHVLGNLFSALAANRISPRRAGTLAYIGCLLTQTQRGAKKEAIQWRCDSAIFDKITEIKFPGSVTPKDPAIPDKTPMKQGAKIR
jgi:hypothetical protein